MKVLACGSRSYAMERDPETGHHTPLARHQRAMLNAVLQGLWQERQDDYLITHADPEFVLIDGCAKGADTFAHEWARALASITDPEGVDVVMPSTQRFLADWEGKGRAAGPIRNRQMLLEGKPDLVVAFIDKPLQESKGTWNMVAMASQGEIPTMVVHVAHTYVVAPARST